MGREKVFRFKRFSVLNDRTAMKVGTDGVLLGAWCPVDGAKRVLDVGTGCGVIALMVAQRNPVAAIDAIDIDHAAIEEAVINFANSPWGDRVVAHEGDFNEWEPCERYDLIVSNPPFFTDNLLPPDMSRSLARHGSALTYAQLIERASRLLTDEGSLAIISPTDAQEAIVEAATFASLPVRSIVNVIPVEGAPAKRTLWLLSRREMPFIKESLTITHSDGTFTREYIDLTKAFYLKM